MDSKFRILGLKFKVLPRTQYELVFTLETVMHHDPHIGFQILMKTRTTSQIIIPHTSYEPFVDHYSTLLRFWKNFVFTLHDPTNSLQS